jgi:hypothetical protein
VILLRTRDRAHLVPAFATPALRKVREGRGTLCIDCAIKIKSLGHPSALLSTGSRTVTES